VGFLPGDLFIEGWRSEEVEFVRLQNSVEPFELLFGGYDMTRYRRADTVPKIQALNSLYFRGSLKIITTTTMNA